MKAAELESNILFRFHGASRDAKAASHIRKAFISNSSFTNHLTPSTQASEKASANKSIIAAVTKFYKPRLSKKCPKIKDKFINSVADKFIAIPRA
jgi:hypothetical protein